MRERHIGLAVSLCGLCLCAAVALAQSPPASPSVADVYPSNNSVYVPNDVDASGWNLGWQLRVQADAVYMTRNNESKDIPVISGPESFGMQNQDFNWKPGTRLSVSLLEDDYELDVVFTKLRDWTASQSGLLTNAVVFDGPSAYVGADQSAKDAIEPNANNPNFLTSGTFFAPINTAALSAAELNELEFLKAGTKFSQSYTSAFQDFEINYKKRPQSGRFIRFGLGYRNVQFGEQGRAALSGTFGTIDTDGSSPGAANNGLSDGSLTGSGLTSFFTTPPTAATATTPATPGMPPANGFSDNTTATTATAPDDLLFATDLNTNNQLNGAQVTSDVVFLESERFELGGFAKVGVFHNLASGTISEKYADVVNDKTTYVRQFSDTKHAATFQSQAGLTGRVFLRQNVRLFGGYEVLFLSGLALAPEQMRAITTDVTSAAALDLRTQGSTFIHGGRAGLEILFW